MPEIAHCDTDDMQNATNLIDTVNWQYWSVTWSSTSERQTIITIIIHTFLHIHGSRVVTSKATTHDSIEMCKLLLLWQTTTKSIYVNAIHQKTLKVTARDLARHKRVYNSAKMINWSTEQPCTITAYHNNVEHRPPQRRIPNNCNLVIPSEYSHLHANILTHTWIFLFSSSSCKRNTKPWHQTSMTDYQITHGLRHWTQTKAEYPACHASCRFWCPTNSVKTLKNRIYQSANQEEHCTVKHNVKLRHRQHAKLSTTTNVLVRHVTIHISDVSIYTVSHEKTCHFVLDYNSGISWSIFIIFVPQETGRNLLI